MQDLYSNITLTMTLTSPFDLVLPKLLWLRIKIVTIIWSLFGFLFSLACQLLFSC